MYLGQCSICEEKRVDGLFSAPDRFHQRDRLYPLLRCPSCSLVWLRDVPDQEEMAFHYGAGYHQAITSAGETGIDKRWNFARERVLESKEGGVLLDIGCSSGGFLRSIKSPDWKLYGVEMSGSQAQRAEKMSGAKIFVGSILDAPFSSSSFDVITGFHVLEHVYQPKEVIRKAWEWLKPGGILYLQVPNIEALDARIFRSYWYGLELPRHIFHFSVVSLRRILAVCEFDEVYIRTLPYTHIEESTYYVVEDLRRKLGISPALRKTPGLVWRVFRKACRLGLLEPLGVLVASAGRGAGIEALLRKPAISDGAEAKRQAG